MNGRNLLMGLSYIDRKFIEESEMDALPKQGGKTLRRPLLVAALIALMLLLVGCAVVYALRLQDLHIGEHTVIHQDVDEPKTTEIQLEVLSLQGMKKTPAHLANQEWLQFTEDYIPERKDYWDSEEDYWAYSVLDQTMVDKIDELCEKYGLKIIGKPWHEHEDCHQFLRLMGVNSLLRDESDAEIHIPQGRFFEGGSFTAYGDIRLTGWETSAYITYQYVCKDVFYDVFAYVNPNLVTEQNYTTADGTVVLLLESEKSGMIMADREDCFITIDVSLTDGISLETVADQFDFTICPKSLDASEATAREQESMEAADKTYDPSSYKEYIDGMNRSDEEKRAAGWSTSEIPQRRYALYDLDGDGNQEVLIFQDGFICSVVGWKNGKTDEGKTYHMKLYENNIMIDQMELMPGEIRYHIFYFANDGSRVFSNPKERSIVRLKNDHGDWWRTTSTDHYAEFDTQITEEEAMEILNAYNPVKLDTQPISEFEEP